MNKELARTLMQASIEFGYNAHKNGWTKERAVERYNEIMEAWIKKIETKQIEVKK